MQLVHALAAGVRGAENGTALIYNRIGSQQIAYYLGDGGFEGTNQVAAGTAVELDDNGGASVYVSQLSRVIVKDVDGLTVRTFTVGEYDANVEVISPSFTGTNYDTGVSGASQPTTLERVLDLVVASFGSTDFNVLVGGSPVTVQGALAALALFVSVKDPAYGAVGDGVEDDTAPIQAALDAAVTLGKVVLFPKGIYRTTAALDWPDGVNLLGIEGHSIIQLDHATAAVLVSSDDGTSRKWAQGLRFSMEQTNTGGMLVQVQGNCFVGFSRCYFNGLFLDPATAVGMLGIGESAHVSNVLLHACTLYLSTDVGSLVSNEGGTSILRMSDCYCQVITSQPAATTRPFVEASTLHVSGCYFDMSAATSADALTILSTGGGLSVITGNIVTNQLGGTMRFISVSVGSDEVFEAANRIPETADLIGSSVSTLVQGALASRRQMSVDSSNAAAIICDFLSGTVFRLLTTNDTAKTLSAEGKCEGLFATLYIRKSGGTTETITFGTGFGSIHYNGNITNGDEITIMLACFDDGLGSGLEWHQVGDASEF